MTTNMTAQSAYITVAKLRRIVGCCRHAGCSPCDISDDQMLKMNSIGALTVKRVRLMFPRNGNDFDLWGSQMVAEKGSR